VYAQQKEPASIEGAYYDIQALAVVENKELLPKVVELHREYELSFAFITSIVELDHPEVLMSLIDSGTDEVRLETAEEVGGAFGYTHQVRRAADFIQRLDLEEQRRFYVGFMDCSLRQDGWGELLSKELSTDDLLNEELNRRRWPFAREYKKFCDRSGIPITWRYVLMKELQPRFVAEERDEKLVQHVTKELLEEVFACVSGRPSRASIVQLRSAIEKESKEGRRMPMTLRYLEVTFPSATSFVRSKWVEEKENKEVDFDVNNLTYFIYIDDKLKATQIVREWEGRRDPLLLTLAIIVGDKAFPPIDYLLAYATEAEAAEAANGDCGFACKLRLRLELAKLRDPY
jgi:hypothetical protein